MDFAKLQTFGSAYGTRYMVYGVTVHGHHALESYPAYVCLSLLFFWMGVVPGGLDYYSSIF